MGRGYPFAPALGLLEALIPGRCSSSKGKLPEEVPAGGPRSAGIWRRSPAAHGAPSRAAPEAGGTHKVAARPPTRSEAASEREAVSDPGKPSGPPVLAPVMVTALLIVGGIERALSVLGGLIHEHGRVA